MPILHVAVCCFSFIPKPHLPSKKPAGLEPFSLPIISVVFLRHLSRAHHRQMGSDGSGPLAQKDHEESIISTQLLGTHLCLHKLHLLLSLSSKPWCTQQPSPSLELSQQGSGTLLSLEGNFCRKKLKNGAPASSVHHPERYYWTFCCW